MSSKREVECLKRLNDLTGQIEDILFFLKEESLINDTSIKTVKNSSDRPREIQSMLNGLRDAGKLQLVEYKWVLLPVETITLFLVTDNNTKQFSYGE
jgi:hypothetical protein